MPGSQDPNSLFRIVKRWPGDKRREEHTGFDHYEVSGWTDFLQARRLLEERKRSLRGHLVIEILDPIMHGWLADIERIGSPLVTVVSASPSEELKAILKTFGYTGEIDPSLNDQVLLDLGVLGDLSRLQNLAKLYWGRLRENDREAVFDLVFATITGLRAFDEPNLGTPGSLLEDLITELIQLRVYDRLPLRETLVHSYFSTILRGKIAKCLRTCQRSEELLISSFQKHVERNDLSSWVDSLLATGILHGNPLVPRLMAQIISRELGIDYPDDTEIVTRIIKLLARDNPRRNLLVTACLQWDRIAEMNTRYNAHLDDLSGLDMIHPSPSDLSTILDSSTGILAVELAYILEKTVGLWKIDADRPNPEEWMARIQGRFSQLLEADHHLSGITQLVRTFGSLEGVRVKLQVAKPVDLPGWSSWYQELLNLEEGLARGLRAMEDLQTTPSFLECMGWLSLKLRELVHAKSNDYVDWLVGNYPATLTSSTGPVLCNCIARIREQLARGGRVILLMIDSLRMDFWYLIQELFAESGVEIENVQTVLSLLPSYTNVSRRSFFGGMAYPSMVEFCANHQPRIDPQDEPKVLALQLGIDPANVKVIEAGGRTGSAVQGNFIYVTDPAAYDWAIRSGYPLTVLVYLMLDLFTHPQQHEVHVHKDMMRAPFETLSKRLARHLASDPAMRLFVATDHGFTSTALGTKVPIPPELETSAGVVDVHPRFVAVGRLPGNAPTKVRDKSMYVFGNDTSVVSADLGLPEMWTFQGSGLALPVDYWIFPRGTDYFSSKGEFAHGGLSFYETLIPFAVLKSRDATPHPSLRLSVEKRVLQNGKEELVTLVLTNTGNVRLRGLHLQMRFEGDKLQEVASGGEVEPSRELRYSILYTPRREGRVRSEIRYSADAMGQPFAEETTLEFSVVPPPEEERRRKLSPRRPADDLLR